MSQATARRMTPKISAVIFREVRPGETLCDAFARVVAERDSLRRNEAWFSGRFEHFQHVIDDAFALAVEEEQRANEARLGELHAGEAAEDAWKCVALLSECLKDAEAECEESDLDGNRAIWRDLARRRQTRIDELTAHRDQLQCDFDDCNADREKVTADWVAACNERDAALSKWEERERELDQHWRDYQERAQTVERERDEAQTEVRRLLDEERRLREALERIHAGYRQQNADLARQRDEAKADCVRWVERSTEVTRQRDEALCRASSATTECGRLEARLEHEKSYHADLTRLVNEQARRLRVTELETEARVLGCQRLIDCLKEELNELSHIAEEHCPELRTLSDWAERVEWKCWRTEQAVATESE